ncbi:MAG: hypothetical protein RLZZ15_675, partial [Verrucomicrobiota bacterium]
INAGTLSVSTLANGSANSGIGASNSNASNLVFNGGTLQYTGATVSTDRKFKIDTNGATIDASGSGALTFTATGSSAFTYGTAGTSRALTLTGSNTGTNTLSGILTDNGAGLTSVTKTGAGNWALSGASTYTGATTVSAGTLSVNGSIVSAVTVNSGGTLGGTGTITSAVTIASGGTVAPGNSPGNLTIGTGGSLTFSSGSTYAWELGSLVSNGTGTAGTNWDLITLAGTATLTTNSVALVPNFTAVSGPTSGNAFWNSSQTWTVVDGNGGTISATFSIDNSSWTSAGSFALAFANSNTDLTMTWTPAAVPEPSTYAAFAGVAALALAAYRRRAKKTPAASVTAEASHPAA